MANVGHVSSKSPSCVFFCNPLTIGIESRHLGIVPNGLDTGLLTTSALYHSGFCMYESGLERTIKSIGHFCRWLDQSKYENVYFPHRVMKTAKYIIHSGRLETESDISLELELQAVKLALAGL